MKAFLLLALGLFFTVSVAEDRCYTQDDCKEGHCCTGGISPYIKGSCQKLATEGERCDPDQLIDGRHFLYCPCIAGLKCFNAGKVMGSRVCVQE